MQAVVQKGYSFDFPEVIEWTDSHPIPVPKPGEILVRVLRAALNPGDFRMVEGAAKMVVKMTFPHVLGMDFCGVVHAVGPAEPAAAAAAAAGGGATTATTPAAACPFAVGDLVCGHNDVLSATTTGVFAQFCVAAVKDTIKVPAGLSIDEAAALPLVANTAYQFSVEKLGLGKPNAPTKVLVLGGSSSIGLLILAACRQHGCTDIVCTSTNDALCRSFGATEVVNYKTTAWKDTLAGRNFDAVIDCVEGYTGWVGAQKALKPKGGRYLGVVIDDPSTRKVMGVGTVLSMIGAVVYRNAWSFFGYPSYTLVPSISSDPERGLNYFAGLTAAKVIPSLVDATSPPCEFTLANVLGMLEKQRDGHCKGKLIVKIAE